MDKVLRVLLIDLGSSRKEINEPIGICAVAAYVEKYAQFGVEIDLRFLPLSQKPTREELARFHVVGLSTKIGSLGQVFDVYSDICMIPACSRPLVVLGDLLATFATQEILRLFPEFICVTGEGEEGFLQLLAAISEHGEPACEIHRFLTSRYIPNLAYMLDGKYIQNESRLIKLELCPPPLRRFSKNVASLGGIVRNEGSRGCAWGKCSFCAIQHKYCNEARWRPIPTERAVSELQELSQMGIKSPFYTDEDFLGDNPIRAIELATEILKKKSTGEIDRDMSLYVDMRVDSILSKGHKGSPTGRQVLAKLKEAGLRKVFIGLESGAKAQVKRYKKASTAHRNSMVLDVLNDLGITFDIGFIMFDPEMDINELSANISFLKQTGLNKHDARMTKKLRIEPGTPLVAEYRAKNLISGGLDVDDLTYPYRWKYSQAEDVYATYSEWEQELSEDVYEIQARTRGEVGSEDLRREWRTILGEVREIELSALEFITSRVSARIEIDKSELRSLQDARNELILCAKRAMNIL